MSLIEVRPTSTSPRDWRFPSFERVTLDSGLGLVVCHLPGRPMAAVRLVLEAGAVTEPEGAAGVALLAARALPEGTESLDGHQLAEATEGMGAEIRGEVSFDSLQVRMDVPASRLATALPLLADVTLRPGMRSSEVERLIKERLDQLAQEKTVPDALASRAFEQTVFVPGSSYARSIGGDEDTVATLSRDAVESFYRGRLEAGAATLIVAGDVEGIDVAALARAQFGSLGAGGDGASVQADVQPAGGGRRIVLVDRPGAVQSALAIGHDGPPRRIDDYVATGTMAMCLGGVFGSRLNLKLREEKGYTYGAGASFDFRRDGGVFTCRTAVQTEVTAAAVVDAIGEIERTASGGIPEVELAPVREYRVGIFPIAYERPSAVASGLADMVVHDLPSDWFDTVRERMAAVTSDDVSAAAASRLRPDELAIVVVGDGARVREELQATGLGPIIEA